jgi:hypothetical protein
MDIDVARAMAAYCGNYDEQKKQCLVALAQPTPDGRFPEATQMVVRPVFSSFGREAGRPTFTLVTDAVPVNEPFDCHACSPTIGMAIFAGSDSKWKIEASNQQVTDAGAWGKPPSDIQIVQIGPSRSAVEIKDTGEGQGETTRSLTLLVPWNGTINVALERIIADDDAGDCGVEGGLPCYSNHRTVTFLRTNNAEYYDMELELEGNDLDDATRPFKAIPVHGVERLTLQDGKYRQAFRRGDLTMVDKVVAKREGLK